MRVRLIAALLLFTTLAVHAEIPGPPKDLADWPMPFAGDFPAVSAADLLDKPAGKNGPVVARDGHFYTGQKRIRFWGVNVAFGGCFPTHEQADAIAKRLSHFGINAVRFHHMDNQPFPNGIFADKGLEKLSPEALDRLNYFIAALAKQGIYSNINLHVSREWAKAKAWPDANQIDGYNKMLDLFHPEIVAANINYARDLLTHVNKYTGNRYFDEPAVCMVEINNEDTMFLWGGEQRLTDLPPKYANMLNESWNRWLAEKYKTRDQLAAAWSVGATGPATPLFQWTPLPGKHPMDYDRLDPSWMIEQHGTAKMKVRGKEMPNDAASIEFDVTAIDGTDWHLQYGRPGLKIEKGKYYSVRFSTHAEKPMTIGVSVSQAHAPWENLGFARALKLTPGPNGNSIGHSFGFTAIASDDNARLIFSFGRGVGRVQITPPVLAQGGRQGLQPNEDFSRKLPNSTAVRSRQAESPDTTARYADWYEFIQHVDEDYFVSMRDFLRKSLNVRAPITGTIALGPLGTRSQAEMDFVDTHEYWDHPHFPRRQWDMKDWLVDNKPMVDDIAGATLFRLAASRVAGKPFTVTEYNHAAPNEWAAEGVPMIASFAALQDWDAVFLFAYSHNNQYDKGRLTGFFDIEGDPSKMAFLPLAARMFLGRDTVGAVSPLTAGKTVYIPREKMLATGSTYYHQMWPFLKNEFGVTTDDLLNRRFAVRFEPIPADTLVPVSPISWTANGPGTGRYIVNDPHGIVFAGFAPEKPLDIGPLRIEKLETPFASITLVPASPGPAIDGADRLLLAVVARVENAGMKRSPDRRTVGHQWGNGPPQIEVVTGELSLPGVYRVIAIKPDGTRGAALKMRLENGRTVFEIGTEKTVWYELIRSW